ncbi:MAG: SRPBCC family protein [Gemmatimonadaceae bacterium]
MATELAVSPSDASPDAPIALLAALGGGLLLGTRSSEPSATRSLSTVVGLALLGVAAHGPVARALQRAGTKRRAGAIRFSFVVEQPVEQVFAFCADFENFPRFMSSLREVRDSGDGRSHWCASTPAGRTVEWDAVTTKFVTNSVIGWRSDARSPVKMTGLLRFHPEEGATCVKVQIDYGVAGGNFADALAALARPKRGNQIEREIRDYFATK